MAAAPTLPRTASILTKGRTMTNPTIPIPRGSTIPKGTGISNRRRPLATEGFAKIDSARLTKLSEQFGAARHVPRDQLPAARLARVVPGLVPPMSQVVAYSGVELPAGYGSELYWDPADPDLATVVAVSAASEIGVTIHGVTAGDTIEVIDAVGIASFDEDIENEGIPGLITVLAAGGDLAASIFGHPEASPVIHAVADYAKELFKEEKVRKMRRDPWGEDPGTGGKARAEGGALICLPQAHGVYYSGNHDHQERWIKSPGIRDFAHYPAHIPTDCARFLYRDGSTNKGVALEDGIIHILAWDHAFHDNFGDYQFQILLKRGTLPPPPIIQ